MLEPLAFLANAIILMPSPLFVLNVGDARMESDSFKTRWWWLIICITFIYILATVIYVLGGGGLGV